MNNIFENDKERILVVAPHPDDESIGCGGILCKYKERCSVLILTDGRRGGGAKSEEEVAILRKDEAKQAAKIAGYRDIFFLDIEDGEVGMSRKQILSFNYSPFRYVLIPNRYEESQDHKSVYQILKKLAKKKKKVLIEYEVWTPLIAPSFTVDISGNANDKRSMIRAHKSQVSGFRYEDMGMALSEYRGIRQHYDYGESFHVCSWIQDLKHNLTYLPLPLKRIVKKIKKTK